MTWEDLFARAPADVAVDDVRAALAAQRGDGTGGESSETER